MEGHESVLETAAAHTQTQFLAATSHFGSFDLKARAKKSQESAATCHWFSSINSLFCPRTEVVSLYLIIDLTFLLPTFSPVSHWRIFPTCWWVPGDSPDFSEEY